ncbi:unnamed protein product [Pieris macdunnoughi]|uniref:Uncharacterized protein n=1 Tax=Pieris macdunnoughi TaxID=345717 RepID=A0A821MUP9_9NEOP|nr:unnamed protein product [Pieris macdunnoughi]
MSRSGEEEPLPLMVGRSTAHVTQALSLASGAGARAVCVRRASATAGPRRTARPPPLPAASFLTIICVFRFLPLLLPRFVLRIIECIPLAPAAMRGERRPDNSRAQLRLGAPSRVTARLKPTRQRLATSCGERR